MAKLKAGESPEKTDAPFKAPEAPVQSQALPKGFVEMDEAIKDGRTVKLWFGKGPDEMTDKYMVLGRWRRTRVIDNKRWVDAGAWCHPHSNMKIGFEFTGWAPVGQVTQADIDTSNAAVHQENLRRAELLKARQTKTDDERVSA